VSRLFPVGVLVAAVWVGHAEAQHHDRQTPALARSVYTLSTTSGDASLPIECSLVLNKQHPEITRLAVVFHGKSGDVEGYFRALVRAAETASHEETHTLLVAPQFLREEDVSADRLPKQILRWHGGSWSAGGPAAGPVPISAFEVIDRVLTAMADPRMLPNLRSIVLVGHSGGAQLLNRYAIVGKAIGGFERSGIHLRFVIANPSSYFYFSDDRPQPDGSYAPAHGNACPQFDHWRYGALDAPSYVSDTSSGAWLQRESDYARDDVIYLLGTDDTDPEQADLDTSCAGELEGPTRLARGISYFHYLQGRHPRDLHHQLLFVPGVAHSGSRMIDSACGISAIFEYGHCTNP